MWGIILGVVGVGLALYEIFTRPTKEDVAAAANVSDAAKANAIAALRQQPAAAPVANPRIAIKASICNLQLGDWQKADAWSKTVIPGLGLDLLQRLVLIRKTTIPYDMWPVSARRVYCTYVGD